MPDPVGIQLGLRTELAHELVEIVLRAARALRVDPLVQREILDQAQLVPAGAGQAKQAAIPSARRAEAGLHTGADSYLAVLAGLEGGCLG